MTFPPPPPSLRARLKSLNYLTATPEFLTLPFVIRLLGECLPTRVMLRDTPNGAEASVRVFGQEHLLLFAGKRAWKPGDDDWCDAEDGMWVEQALREELAVQGIKVVTWAEPMVPGLSECVAHVAHLIERGRRKGGYTRQGNTSVAALAAALFALLADVPGPPAEDTTLEQ